MNKLQIAGLILLALVLITTSVFSAPHMSLPETEFNFGYVPQQSKVSHEFWIHSDGDDSLKIIKVVPG